MKLIGLDIGTTSLCGVVVDTHTNAIVDQETRLNDASVVGEGPAHLQDASKILSSVQSIVELLVGRHKDVAGVCVSGQMHGILYLDKHGNPVSPLFTWLDRRGNLLCDGNQTYREAFARLTGYDVPAGYGLLTHFVHVQNQEVPRDATVLCTVADYVTAKLANIAHPVTDPTLAASLGVFDLVNSQFDGEALLRAGIVPSMLPTVVPSCTAVGEMADGVQVVTAVGDNQASHIGSVQSLADTLLVNVGTGAQLSLMVPEHVSVPGFETRPFPGNRYLLVGATLGGGKAYALVESFFRQVLDMSGVPANEPLYGAMDRLLRMASEQSVNDQSRQRDGGAALGGVTHTTLTVSPQFYGTRTDPSVRGAITNVSEDNFTPLDLMVGVLDGIVVELHQYVQALPTRLQMNIKHLVGAGNAIRKNGYLASVVQDIFGRSLLVPGHREEAAVGAALCAGVGVGAYESFQEAAVDVIDYQWPS